MRGTAKDKAWTALGFELTGGGSFVDDRAKKLLVDEVRDQLSEYYARLDGDAELASEPSACNPCMSRAAVWNQHWPFVKAMDGSLTIARSYDLIHLRTLVAESLGKSTTRSPGPRGCRHEKLMEVL